MRAATWGLVFGFLFFLFLGCSDFAGKVRGYTYPPDFHYISSEQLRSTMWQLAYHSRELKRLMTAPESPTANRSKLLEHLEAMERAVVELNRTGWPTNHPLIDANRSSFLRDIKTAADALKREPPDYVLASSVTGACVYCHGGRPANN